MKCKVSFSLIKVNITELVAEIYEKKMIFSYL